MRKVHRRWWRAPTSSILVVHAIALIILRCSSQADAISANPNPIIERDENGNPLPPMYVRGDETYHWYEDERGYTLIDDPSYDRKTAGNRTTPKVYADISPKSGDLLSTGVRFGSADATLGRLKGVKKHAKPAEYIRRAKCGHYCDDEPSANSVRGSSIKRGPNQRRHLQEHANRRKLMSSTTSLRNLVVLIRFADHHDRTLPSVSDFDDLMNGPGGEGTVAPTGSVNDVFLANSYGTFSLDSTIYPWVTVSKSEAYYADGVSGIGPKLFEAIREALGIIDSDPSIDLTEFNTDINQGDPYIDAITVFHSGYGAEFGGTDCYGAPESGRIWSHSWFMHTGAWTSQDGTISVMNYHINPGLWDVCGSEISRIGVVAHETSHFLGLPDLYDPDGGNGVGVYCLMSDSWGLDGSQLYPPMLSAWSKIELGWMTPMVLDTKGDYELRQSWRYPDAYKVELGYQSGEYLLIENRQPGSFDSRLPLGGLAIWHIDESMYYYVNSLEGYPGQPRWPANGNHYSVALLQADGRYDLEKGLNRGDYSDLFRYDYYFGVDYLFPSESDPMLGPFPNTDSYKQGVLQRTNHFVSGISATGPSMMFSFLPSSPCQPGEMYFELTLLTDGRGNEVSWALVERYSEVVTLSGNGYGNYAQSKVEECIPAKCYTFTVNDAGNDGLCCEQGYGGYSVRLNGLKVASGNAFGSIDETDLRCMIPPTNSPTSPPTESNIPSSVPSAAPSSKPSIEPTFAPTGVCGRGKGVFEIIVEGDEFIDEISWNVQDVFGNVVISSDEDNASGGGFHIIQECIDLNACYTFSIQDSLHEEEMVDDDTHRGLYTVRLDGEVIVSGSNFRRDQSSMFGAFCLHTGDTACSPTEEAAPMSMFRLEMATDDGSDITWTLVDGAKEVVRSAGPFGNCDVNTLAMCLPSQDCYEFTIRDGSGDGECCSYEKGLYTVMFSQIGGMIQNYTGPVLDMQRVYLGTCYDKNN